MNKTLIFAAFLCLAGPAAAGITTVSGADEMDGTSFTGLRMASMDGAASLFFICDSHDRKPRVVFFHDHFMTSSGSKFELHYRVDGGTRYAYLFQAGSSGTIGTLQIDYIEGSIYRPRFGKRPKKNRGFNDWRASIHNQFVADFAAGEEALVRAINYNGRAYDYRFDLTDLTDSLATISACYTAPTEP